MRGNVAVARPDHAGRESRSIEAASLNSGERQAVWEIIVSIGLIESPWYYCKSSNGIFVSGLPGPGRVSVWGPHLDRTEGT
jgi:hypothetical protein